MRCREQSQINPIKIGWERAGFMGFLGFMGWALLLGFPPSLNTSLPFRVPLVSQERLVQLGHQGLWLRR